MRDPPEPLSRPPPAAQRPPPQPRLRGSGALGDEACPGFLPPAHGNLLCLSFLPEQNFGGRLVGKAWLDPFGSDRTALAGEWPPGCPLR